MRVIGSSRVSVLPAHDTNGQKHQALHIHQANATIGTAHAIQRQIRLGAKFLF